MTDGADVERRDRLRLVLAVFAVGGLLVAAIGVAGLGAGGLSLGEELDPSGPEGPGGGGFEVGWLDGVLGGVGDLIGGVGQFADDILRLLGGSGGGSGTPPGGAVPVDQLRDLPFRPDPSLLRALENANFDVEDVPFDSSGGSLSQLLDGRSVLRDGEYAIIFGGQPVPGERARVYVGTADGPAEDVTIEINGQAVGQTNAQGVATVEVPYASQLRVDAVPPEDASPAVREPAPSGREQRTATTLTAHPVTLGSAGTTTATQSGDDRTVDLSGATAIRFTPEPVPGAAVSLQVLVYDTPVEGVDVSFDGRRVGRTDSTGRVDATVPRQQRVELAVERDSFAYEQTISIVNLTVSTAGPVGPVLPGQPVNVTVESDARPLAGATVAIEGAPDGTTGADGSYRSELSWVPRSTITVETSRGVTVRKTVWPILPVGAVGLLLVAVGALLAHSYGSERAQRLADRLARLLQRAIAMLIAVGARGERALELLSRRLAVLLDRLSDRLSIDALRAIPARLVAWLRTRLGDEQSAVEPADSVTPADTPARTADARTADARSTDSIADSRARVREAWARLQRRTPGRPHRTTPPGTIATRAIQAGWPREQVRTLLGAIRSVEFGETPPEDRVEAAEQAAAHLDEPGDDPDTGDEHPENPGDRS